MVSVDPNNNEPDGLHYDYKTNANTDSIEITNKQFKRTCDTTRMCTVYFSIGNVDTEVYQVTVLVADSASGSLIKVQQGVP